MINTPTTLVLGAGASIPYGFPSGKQLREEICKAGESELGDILQQIMPVGPRDIGNFTNTFLRSSVISIDSFLSRNPHFVEIGKLCIAVALCQKEDRDKVILANDDHWYSYLWNILIEDAVTVDDLMKNKIKFISFNYDRSLEYFLFQSAKNTFGLQDFEALKIVKHFDILHVYGSLGEFGISSDERNNVLEYSPIEDVAYFRLCHVAANGIKVIPEARNDSDEFIKARLWFGEAESIGFFGFGFDSLNVHRLGLINVLQARRQQNGGINPRLAASVFGMTDIEVARIRHKLCGNLAQWVPIDERNTMAIRRSGLLIV